MKTLFGLIFLVLLIVVGINGAIYLKYGKIPLRDWAQSVQHNGVVSATNELIPEYKKLFDQTVNNSHAHESSKPVKIYKWTDNQGVIHYDNRPIVGAESLDVDPDTNMLPLPPVVTLPAGEEAKPKAKTMEEETQAILDKKRAYMESLTQ